MNTFFYLFIVFFTYSVIGWMVESLYVGIKFKNFINRGFLIGPYCPIYGCGSLVMILYLEQYRDNPFTVFLLAVVICSFLEYITSYIMEKAFKTRWWDYSDEKFNLNGRICGKNALLFGFGGIGVIYFGHPFLNNIYNMIGDKALLIITIICMLIFIVDVVISFNVINRFKKTVTSIDLKRDSTQDFKKMVSETIMENRKVFQSRLLKAFPNINPNRFKEFSNGIKTRLKM